MTNKMTTAEGNTTAATKKPASAHGGEGHTHHEKAGEFVPQIDGGEYGIFQMIAGVSTETGRVVVQGSFPTNTEHWFLYTGTKNGTGPYAVPSKPSGGGVITLQYRGDGSGFNAGAYNQNLPPNTYIKAVCNKIVL